jgi:hypothetical protein
MKTVTRPIDNAYMLFFVSYCETLKNTCGDYWNNHRMNRFIDYAIKEEKDEFINTGEIPKKYNKATYQIIESTGSIIPPDCRWVSNSGRFSCQDLCSMIGTQAYILWDLKRKVLLPVLFHDLEGIDEKEHVIFCRSNNTVFHFGDYCDPLRLDLEWINIPLYYESMPDELIKRKMWNSIKALSVAAEKGVQWLDRNETDLSEYYAISTFPDIFDNELQLLISKELDVNEKLKLARRMQKHPDFSFEDAEYFLKELSKYTDDDIIKQSIIEMLRVGKMNDDLDDGLPF